jgi:hypothetical protein
MADNIVGSLFGLTPEMYGEQQRVSALGEGISLANLNPAARGAALTYAGAKGLGGAIGGAMGIQDPQLKIITQRQQLLQQLDMTDPNSLVQGAQLATRMGDAQMAAGLIDRAKTLSESTSKIALQQAQTLKALQPAKLTGDERYIADLRNVETKLQEGKQPTSTELSNANMAAQMLAKPRSFFDQASGQMVTVPATDPSKAFPETFKAMAKTESEGGVGVPKPTAQQATEGNIPSASQKDIAEIDASLVKLENSKPQLKSLSDSIRTGDVKFNAAANAFDFLGAVVPPVFGGQEVGNQVKKDEFTRAITERVNFVLNNAKGVQAKDDAQRAKDQIATPSTFYSSARMQGAIDSLIRAETTLEEELKTRKSTLQNQGKPKVAPTAKKSEAETVEKSTTKPTQTSGSMTKEQMIDAVIQFNAEKGRAVTRSQAEKALRDAKKL